VMPATVMVGSDIAASRVPSGHKTQVSLDLRGLSVFRYRKRSTLLGARRGTPVAAVAVETGGVI